MKRSAVVIALVAAAVLVMNFMNQETTAARAKTPGARSAAIPRAATSGAGASVRRSLAFPWGGGSGQFGARMAQESNPEGPMSVIASGSSLHVLDQVNGRIVRLGLDGSPTASFPIGPDTAQDIAVGPDGRVAVLDRVTDGQVLYYDNKGDLVGQTSVVGGPLVESGGATGIFIDSRGVYVEREHGEVVRVLGPDGTPDPDRHTLPGRPLRDGAGSTQALITSKLDGTTTLRVFGPTADLVWQRSIRFPAPIVSLVMLDSDRHEHIYLAAHLAVESPAPPYALTNERILVVRVDQATGADRGSLVLPPPAVADEALRPLTIGDDGTIYQMLPSASGLEILAHAFP